MAVGSSMLATIRTAPPQWAQVVMSMEKTRLSRCAQLIARRFCSGLRGSSWALTSTGAASPAGRLPRPEGVSCARQVCIRGEYAVEAGEMRARWRDQCRQLGDEVHRIPFDMRGPISPRRLELIPHPTLR